MTDAPPASVSFDEATPVTSTMSAVRAQSREIAQLNVQVAYVGSMVQTIARMHLHASRMFALVISSQLALLALVLWLVFKAK